MQDSNSATHLRVLVSAFACGPGGGSGHFGGGETVLGWSVIHQLARFHHLAILTHSLHQPAIESALSRTPNDQLEFHYFALPRWLEALKSYAGGIQFYAYLWQVKAYFVARRLHKQHPFDLFHHVTYANDWMASFIGALLPVPYVRGPGGGAQQVPKAFVAGFSRRGRFWERVRSAGQQVLRHDPFFMLGQRRARAILVCTPEALATIPRKWRHKAQLFPVNGITTEDLRLTGRDRQSPMPKGLDGDPALNGNRKTFRVVSAGKLLELKAFDLAIRAFHRLMQRAPESTFTLIGDGPERLRLEGLIQELGLGEKVHIEKWMRREELLRAMAHSDAFLFPSLRDGGGAVVIEAMAAGNPVVCLDHAGPAIHITEECGVKVVPRNPDQAIREMAEALYRLYSDPDLRLRMGRAARERAEQVYHWDHQGDRLLQIYRSALQLYGEPSLNRSGRQESVANNKA